MSDMNEIIIEDKIVGWDVKTTSDLLKEEPVLQDIDPRRVSIERREEGTWESITRKCVIVTGEGTKKFYFVIGFGRVTGIRNGQTIEIERPLEFFIPGGQTDSDQEWITATMRSLSLAARAGFVAKALADFRKVVAGNQIWYGKHEKGNPRIHSSLVATLAWAMQDELYKRGYLTKEYEERDLDDLIIGPKHNIVSIVIGDGINIPAKNIEVKSPNGVMMFEGQPKVADCPKCQDAMILKDGCPTCISCGYSKCG